MKQKSRSSIPLRSKLNADKVIGLIAAVTPIRKYRGVLENYVRWSLSTLKSEGKQAQDRLKSYKEYFETQLAQKSVQLPKSGKFKKLLPILRILDECLRTNDLIGIRTLATVMRIYGLALPTEKYLSQKLYEYVFNVGEDIQIIEENPHDINQSMHIEKSASIIAREQAMYPDFPWGEFRDWIATLSDTLPALVKGTRPKVQISASLLVKSSASKVKVGKGSKSKFKSQPAITLADIEQAFQDTVNGTENLPRRFARALLSSLDLSSSFKYDSNVDEILKDPEGFKQYIDNDALMFRMYAMVIAGSEGIKERTVIKGSYPFQYPLQLFHDSAIAVAQKIPGDYSGDHDAGFRSLNAYATDADFLADTDATSWTDFFPLSFQYEVVKAFYGQDVAELWVQLMRCPIHAHVTYPDGERHLVRFRMRYGQPMGLYGSWAIANLSHHMLVRFAYSRVNSPYHEQRLVAKNSKGKSLSFKVFDKPYWLIGDDEVSADPVAQSAYTALESALGIKINATKSKVLSRQNGKYLAELAHRQTLSGSEVTGISPKLVVNSLANYSRLAELLQFCRSRGFTLDESKLIGNLVYEQQHLSRREYASKYGAYPIPKSQIELGLRIPACVGGLLPDDSNWNSKVDPLLLLEAMLFRISSLVTYFRPGAPILRDGRQNADEILASMINIPDCINVEHSALSRYERRVFAEKANALFMREAGQALETTISELQRTFAKATLADYSTIDMEAMHQWITGVLANLKSISVVPAYLAREYEARSVQETIIRLNKFNPDKFASTEVWANKINLEFQRLRDRLNHLTGSIFEKKTKTESQEDMTRFYESLFSD